MAAPVYGRYYSPDIIEKDSKSDIPIKLCDDGRYYSPGHNAKYCTYTLIEENSGKIVNLLTKKLPKK